jgi:hypothetical protein
MAIGDETYERTGTFDSILNDALAARGVKTFDSILAEALNPKQKQMIEWPPGSGQMVDPEALTPEQAAILTGKMTHAKPDEAGGFSFTEALFDILDIPGAAVRGVAGAITDPSKAGERLLSALPGSEEIPRLFGGDGFTAPTGSDLLQDLGWKKGSTMEDERRVRIAVAAGLSEREARQRFGQWGSERPDVDTQAAFDALSEKVAGEVDTGITMDDWQNAIDSQDFAGFALDIALDPLTYMTFGASAAGKAAKAISMAGKHTPKLLEGLRGAQTASEASAVVRGIEGASKAWKDRTAKLVERAFQ